MKPQSDKEAAAQAKPGDESGLLGLTVQKDPRPPSRVMARLRNYFFTGLIIVGPVSITVYIVWWFIALIDGWVKPLVPAMYLPESYLPFTIPGAGLIFAIIGLILIGAFTANLFGRTLVTYGEDVLHRMPIVRNVYRALKQIFETVLSKRGGTFEAVGLMEFPREGIYSLAFIAAETVGEIKEKTGQTGSMVSVFIPLTPNPTSGYLVFVPSDQIQILDMTVEEGAKLLISAGLITPAERQEQLEKLADRVKAEDRPRVEKPEPVS